MHIGVTYVAFYEIAFTTREVVSTNGKKKAFFVIGMCMSTNRKKNKDEQIKASTVIRHPPCNIYICCIECG